MTDEKISQMPAASSLTGSELVELIQSGGNVKATTQDIADLVPPSTAFPGLFAAARIPFSGTTPILIDQINVSTIIRISTGTYNVALSINPSSYLIIVPSVLKSSAGGWTISSLSETVGVGTTGFQLKVYNSLFALADPTQLTFFAVGN